MRAVIVMTMDGQIASLPNFRVQLPEMGPKISSLLACPADLAVIETAPVGKTDLALLAWLLNQALKFPGKHVWCHSSLQSYKKISEYWLSLGLVRKWIKLEKTRLVIPPIASEVLFVPHDDLVKIPATENVRCCVIGGAHLLKDDPLLWTIQATSGQVRIFGQVAAASHWFHRLARDAQKKGTSSSAPSGNASSNVVSYHRLTANDALAAKTITQKELDRAFTVLPSASYRQIYQCESEAEQDAVEAALSVRKFSEQRLFIRDKAGKVIPFRLNSLQQTFLAMRRLAVKRRGPHWQKKFLLLKYRRGGFTTLIQAENYKTCVTIPNSQVVTLAHNVESTKRIFRIAHLYHERDEKALALKGSTSGSKLEFDQLNSLFFIGTAGSTGFGRGDTLQRVHGSEVSKWCRGPRSIETVADLVAGLTEAASHGEVILETTADGNEWFAQTYKEAKKNQNDWCPIFVPWFLDPTNIMPCIHAEIHDTLTDDEKELIKQHRLIYEQIAWRRMKKRSLQKLFKQEYPEDDETCFLTSGVGFFDLEQIVDMLEKLPDYERKICERTGYSVEWEAPIKGEKYVVGVDTSEGLPECDPNGIGILRKSNGKQVFAIHGLYKPDVLARLAVEASKRYNNALLGVERNNHGHAVLQKVIELGYGKSHELGGSLYYAKKGRPGWDTNEATRPVMLDDVSLATEAGYMQCSDRDFLGECCSFKLQSNGRWEADPGTHDDCVIKWAIAWQMRNVRLIRPNISVLGGEDDKE